jgi:DNA-binding response OmpR family regulator
VPENPPYRDDYLSVNFTTRSVTVEGLQAILTNKEYELFAMLVKWAGVVVPREALVRTVWNRKSASRTLRVHIQRLRKKLGPHVTIETVFGSGYRFQPPREV